jgi:hypothetical protein
LPIVAITIDPTRAGADAAEFDRRLRAGEPSIHMWQGGNELWLNPQTVADEEGPIIVARLRAILAEVGAGQPVAAP